MKADIKQRIDMIRHGRIPKGYKKTNIGVSPVDWKASNIGTAIELVERPVIMEDDGLYKLITVRRNFGGIDTRGIFKGENILVKSQFLVKEHDFIISKRQISHGACGIADKQADGSIVSNEYNVFIARAQTDICYFNYYMQLPKTKRLFYLMSIGVHIEKLLFKTNDWLKQQLPFPSASEQHKIAEILVHCDKVIDLKKQLIEEKRKTKKWLMWNLLDPNSGVRLHGFNGKWKQRNMGDLFDLLPSVSASREQLGKEGYCYLHYGDIHKSTRTFINVEQDFENIPKLKINGVPQTSLLRHGDVVFVDASEDYEGASKYVVVENKLNITFIAGLHTIVARSKNDVLNIDFKKYCFQSCYVKKQIMYYASGAKVVGLSKTNIAKLSINYPKTEEQIAIANILSAADKEIELLEQELEQWNQKKKALMQLLLTGIVRTV
ncbi:MAG: hypothetical protein GX434_00590 [Peptococcaceae bacterium]|nr:hypothetical protein [Peptococcaceae bacterium]